MCIVGAMRRGRHRKGETQERATNRNSKAQSQINWDRHAVAAIAIAVLIAYFPSVYAGFTNWDDDRFIFNNPLFQGPISAYVAAALTKVQFQAYHPLHLLSYLPDRLLWPHHAAGFHALNLGLFATALSLGYFLLRRTLAILPALGAILLVGLHPLAVESVAWVVGRKDVLALLLIFTALMVEDREPHTRRSTVIACVLAVLACLAKTSAVVLPIVLFAWLTFTREVPWRVALRRCVPFVVIAIAFALPVPFIWQKNQMIPSARPLPFVLDVMGTLGIYVGRVLMPLDLSPVYPSLAPGQAIAGIAMVCMLLILVASWRRLPSAIKFAAVAFIGCLLPVANITQVYFRFADRYVLVALVVLAWPIAKLLAWPKARMVVMVLVPLLIGIELWATMMQVSVWKDSITLWQHATGAQPRAIFAHLKLGETLRAEKRFREAASSYVRAGEIEPGSIKGPAGFLRTMGEKAEAEGRIPPGTFTLWEEVIAKPGFDAQKMGALIETLDKSDCRSCKDAMLWLALRMFPQSDASLVSFARRELDKGRIGTAMVYLSEIRDPNTEGLAELSQRLTAKPND
jgi:hypothetical protein